MIGASTSRDTQKCAKALVSLGRQDPPNAKPGFR